MNRRDLLKAAVAFPVIGLLPGRPDDALDVLRNGEWHYVENRFHNGELLETLIDGRLCEEGPISFGMLPVRVTPEMAKLNFKIRHRPAPA